jgi:hypothetical protein
MHLTRSPDGRENVRQSFEREGISWPQSPMATQEIATPTGQQKSRLVATHAGQDIGRFGISLRHVAASQMPT